MWSEIVLRLAVDNEDVADGMRPDQHFDRIIKELEKREPETTVYVEQGVLDTLKVRATGVGK